MMTSCGGTMLRGEYGDMVEMGVIDPAKVTITALSKTSSVAGIFLTTEAVVRNK